MARSSVMETEIEVCRRRHDPVCDDAKNNPYQLSSNNRKSLSSRAKHEARLPSLWKSCFREASVASEFQRPVSWPVKVSLETQFTSSLSVKDDADARRQAEPKTLLAAHKADTYP